MTPKISKKQLLIDKANKRVIIMTSIAAFVVVFTVVASQALLSQMLYQNKIISAKKEALSQLRKNEEAITSLNSSYTAFVGTPQNVIGGSSDGTGPQDGDNAKIILDALPSKYDFPALATSLEKILKSQNLQIQSIAGTDDEVAQAGAAVTSKPQVIAIPFQVAVNGNYDAVQKLTQTFERSIRPIELQTMVLSGDDANLALSVTAQTYYQPEKTFNIGKKVIK